MKLTTLAAGFVGLCILIGLVMRAFYSTEEVVAGLVAVIVVFGFGFIARFGRVGLSRKFPFIRFRIVLPSAGE